MQGLWIVGNLFLLFLANSTKYCSETMKPSCLLSSESILNDWLEFWNFTWDQDPLVLSAVSVQNNVFVRELQWIQTSPTLQDCCKDGWYTWRTLNTLKCHDDCDEECPIDPQSFTLWDKAGMILCWTMQGFILVSLPVLCKVSFSTWSSCLMLFLSKEVPSVTLLILVTRRLHTDFLLWVFIGNSLTVQS